MDVPQLTRDDILRALEPEGQVNPDDVTVTYQKQHKVWAWVHLQAPGVDPVDAILTYTPSPVGWICRDIGTSIDPADHGAPPEIVAKIARPGWTPR